MPDCWVLPEKEEDEDLDVWSGICLDLDDGYEDRTLILNSPKDLVWGRDDLVPILVGGLESHWDGHQALCVEIIRQNVVDARRGKCPSLMWLIYEDRSDKHLLTFQECCEILRCDHNIVRNGIVVQLVRQVSSYIPGESQISSELSRKSASGILLGDCLDFPDT